MTIPLSWTLGKPSLSHMLTLLHEACETHEGLHLAICQADLRRMRPDPKVPCGQRLTFASRCGGNRRKLLKVLGPPALRVGLSPPVGKDPETLEDLRHVAFTLLAQPELIWRLQEERHKLQRRKNADAARRGGHGSFRPLSIPPRRTRWNPDTSHLMRTPLNRPPQGPGIVDITPDDDNILEFNPPS